MKTIRKFGCISAALAAITALACCAFFLFLSFGGVKNKAFAEDNALPPAELIVDFQSDEMAAEVSGNVTITGGKAVLKQGGAVAAKEKFLSFRLYVSAKIAGEMKISFGNAALICGENGFSAQGAAQTFHEKRALSGDVLIALTVSNGRIEAGRKKKRRAAGKIVRNRFQSRAYGRKDERGCAVVFGGKRNGGNKLFRNFFAGNFRSYGKRRLRSVARFFRVCRKARERRKEKRLFGHIESRRHACVDRGGCRGWRSCGGARRKQKAKE